MNVSSAAVTPDPDEAGRLLRLATNLSVAVAIVLIFAKGYAWWQTDSVAILASLLIPLWTQGRLY